MRPLLVAIAEVLEGIEMREEATGTGWSTEGVTFAMLTDAGIELRLDPAVADAAARTPDTEASPRGPEWIRFHPRALDGHAVDRLEAWFVLARKRASTAEKGSR